MSNKKITNFTPKGYFPEENQEATLEIVKRTRAYFEKEYGYVNLGAVEDKIMIEYLHRDYIKNLPEGNQMFYFYDYLISQNLVDVQE
jgi:hypothetical protein